MGLRKQDSEFRYPPITNVDFKLLDMERVLTAFLARLWHRGPSSRLSRTRDLPIDAIVATMADHEDRFTGFAAEEDTVRRWVETHLVDMVNRGRPTEAVAGLRPLHGFTYRFRSTRHSRPYNADEQLYAMLSGSGAGAGTRTLEFLKDFFFAGVDAATERPLASAEIDVETQALLHLSTLEQEGIEDRPGRNAPNLFSPLCPSQADLLADDVRRLMMHRSYIPRSVMVEYFKILFAFHLALYHLRLLTLLPTAVADRQARHTCVLDNPGAEGLPGVLRCPHNVHLVLDVVGEAHGPMVELAERSAKTTYDRIPAFVTAAYQVKKLDEFGQNLARKGKLRNPGGGELGVDVALSLLDEGRTADRDAFFTYRLDGLLEHVTDEDELPEEVRQILELKLDPFTSYIEVLSYYRTAFHQRYITQCLDSLLLKNRPGALIFQSRGRTAARRFVLDSGMLEVLTQIAVLRPDGAGGFHTAPLRVDEFLAVLRERYGLFIDRLPAGDGFASASIDDHAALRANVASFLDRLREIGFYTDLSDAYLNQTIRPRYSVHDRLDMSNGTSNGRRTSE